MISTPEGIGGAERVLAALIRRGAALGFEQIVLNPFGSGSSELADSLDARVLMKPADGFRHLPSLRGWLRDQVEEFKPDLVHSHLFHASVAVASLRSGRFARLMSHQHGAFLGKEGRHFEQLLDRWAGRRFDRVAACSEFVRSFLLDSYGYSSDRVVTVLNGWEGTPQLRSGSSVPTIVCVANFRPEKGHTVLLDAFEEVSRLHSNAQLLLVGSGPLRQQLCGQTRRLGIEHAVSFLGTVDDVWPILARADVFVLPSLYESLGIVVMEAMAAGLPVVASDVGGVPELVEPGATGSLVPAGDAAALAQALKRMLSSAQERLSFGAEARRRSQRLTMDATVETYFALYSELCDVPEAA